MTRNFRSRPVGWRGESHRHYLASKGVSTRRYSARVKVLPIQKIDLDFKYPLNRSRVETLEERKFRRTHPNADYNYSDESIRRMIGGFDSKVERTLEDNRYSRQGEFPKLRREAKKLQVKQADDEKVILDEVYRDSPEKYADSVRGIDEHVRVQYPDDDHDEEFFAKKDNSIDWMKAPPGVKYDFYGIDSKGRRVRLYGKVHADKAASSKFSRIERLNKKYDSIEGSVKKDLDVKDVSKRENARATYVILKTGLRPGSDKDTKADVEASGLTTLNDDEVRVVGSTSRFKFVGKKGVSIDKSVRDPTLARIVKEQKRLKGDELFPNISDSSVRGYVRKFGAFKTKDFRTLYANKLAKGLVKQGVPKKQVIEKVAGELQNTPAVASGSYIDPKVFK